MKFFLLSIFLSFACSFAWSQPSGSLPPTPPPPSPDTVGGIGLPPLYLSISNIKPTQFQGPSGNSPDFLKSTDLKGTSSSDVSTNQSGSWQSPKSVESNIQGLQFVKPSPF
jgi:hypothetical protein